jgi:hypothetical protein
MTQTQQILKHLEKGNKLTSLEALSMFQCFRLAARIRDLKDSGHDIKSHIIKVGDKKIASYLLNKAKQ